MLYEQSCSEKFRNIYRKTPVLESLLMKFQAFFEEHLWTHASLAIWMENYHTVQVNKVKSLCS